MRKHSIAAALFVAALVATVLLAGCGGTSDRQGDALKSVQAFTQALHARNYSEACGFYAKSEMRTKPYVLNGVSYSPVLFCAIALESNEAQSIMFYGGTFYDGFKVDPQPRTDKKAPVNGYVFKVTYASGVIFVAVQRDSSGAWKVVGISG